MDISINSKDKMLFIKWFLKQYQLKKRESIWILHYLINHQELLERVHFVLEARFCPRAIIMSTHCSKETSFRFYKKHIVTTDADKSFHDIRLHGKEPLYIQLNFQGANQSIPYAKVLENNPYLPEDFFLTENDKWIAEEWLTYTLYMNKREHLISKINDTLDQKNQEAFEYYSQQLNSLESSSPIKIKHNYHQC